ncbi:MAG: hypothetical protein JJE35_06115 [Thermoleophilia bacterium]|nr:hypothetical protein [Thermoleophilia bacterium]
MAGAIKIQNLRAKFHDAEGETTPLDQFWSGFTALEREALPRETNEGDFFMPIAISTKDSTLGENYWRVAESPHVAAGGIQFSKPEGAPANLHGFAAHVVRDRFPADIEEQIEQAWGD